MSHFYNRKSYTFGETDEMLTDIRKEMSNFITKEEAELLWSRKLAIYDPPPFYESSKITSLLYKVEYLTEQVRRVQCEMNEMREKLSLKKDEFDEPTM